MTSCIINFHQNGKRVQSYYYHSDGYPEGHFQQLAEFLHKKYEKINGEIDIVKVAEEFHNFERKTNYKDFKDFNLSFLNLEKLEIVDLMMYQDRYYGCDYCSKGFQLSVLNPNLRLIGMSFSPEQVLKVFKKAYEEKTSEDYLLSDEELTQAFRKEMTKINAKRNS